MRDQYADDTIAVELTIRHTRRDGTTERRHEIINSVGSDSRPQWLNRHIVAAVDTAVARMRTDFDITADDIDLGRARDYITARPDTTP